MFVCMNFGLYECSLKLFFLMISSNGTFLAFVALLTGYSDTVNLFLFYFYGTVDVPPFAIIVLTLDCSLFLFFFSKLILGLQRRFKGILRRYSVVFLVVFFFFSLFPALFFFL